MKLHTKILLWFTGVLLLSGIVTMFLGVQMTLESTNDALERNLYNIAETVSKLPVVIEGLKEPPDKDGEIQTQTLNILDASNDLDYIVVCNMDSIRYSHPNQQLIGEPFVGGDDAAIRVSPERYTSIGEGTLGVAIRAFVPVFDYEGEQIGFVTVGTLRATIKNAEHQLVLY